MLSISPAIRIFVHTLPTDMRKSFDGLYGIVQHAFSKDVFQGDYFVFLNRARDRCKILYWDRDGLVVWAKRLERGCFQLPGGADAASLTIEVDSTTLAMILGGVDLHTGQRRKRYQAPLAREASETISGNGSARRAP
jgi:transposase